MNSRARLTAVGLALTSLVACGAPTPHAPKDQEAADAAAAADPNSNEKTVFDDLVQTQDRARAVEGVVMDGKARTDAAIEAAQGDGSGDQ
jgi:hypothetical protein